MRRAANLLLLLAALAARAADNWQTQLGGMPLRTNVTELNATNCVNVVLRAFQSNDVVKAVIFMPGAVDTFFWHRATRANLTNDSPTLLDAIVALTNQTRIHATFTPPFLLLHFDPDPITAQWGFKDAATVDKLKQRHFVTHAIYNDRDWDSMLPILRKAWGVTITPKLHSRYSFHFYRSSFAAWNLSGWEALEAVSLATKTTFIVEKRKLSFTEDFRDMTEPAAGR
jgi:hypothetical protein